jgi:motility quorum-sensing regulator/GCU-specific mRNA interferase toxin
VILGQPACGASSSNSVSETSPSETLAVIASLSRREFYKSMTTYADHRVWRDVCHAPTPVRTIAYIKISLRDTAPVIQFKEV